ncbi:MAG: MFS transporter [Pseudomonadota bacterium]
MTDETQETRTASPAFLAPIYWAGMVCSMGMMGFVASAGPLAEMLGMAAWQIGLSATAGGFGWVISARAWGRAADRTGRKKVLLFGIVGFAVAYLLLSLSAFLGAAWGLSAMVVLTLFVAIRFSMGLCYAALPAASNALIADNYRDDERAGAMGRLGAAQSSGLLLGPAFVALLAGPSPAAILLVLAILPLPVLFYTYIRLPADRPLSSDIPEQLSLTDPRLIRPLVAVLFAMMSVGIAQIVIGFVALDRLEQSTTDALRVSGIALATVGVALVVAQLLIKRLGWQPTTLIVSGGLIAAAGFLFAVAAASPVTLVASYGIAGFGAGWVLPGISAAAANAVKADEQGRAAGAVSSAMGVGIMIGPVLGGVVYGLSPALPFAAGSVFMLLVALAMWRPAGKDKALARP